MFHYKSFSMYQIFQKIYRGFLFAILVFITISCSDVEEYAPESSFVKIYNDEKFESAYIPMDIVQADDSGFFILSAFDAWNTYLLRVDKSGVFMWDHTLEDTYVNPTQGLFNKDGAFYFFCMDNLSLATYLMKASDATKSASVDRTYGNVIYPLHASAVSDGYLLESYDRESYSTQLTKLNADFSIVWEEKYEVEQDVEEPIISHLTRIGRRLPFFTGEAGNTYFLNGYYNYSLSLLFVNAGDGKQKGVINGFRDESALSSVLYLDGNNYAMSRYDFEDNVIIPKADINTTDIGISTDLEGNDHPEMAPNAMVHSELINVNGKEIRLYATTTKAGQILLYAYDALSGKLVGTHHLGNINPYEAIDFVAASDGGLVILGNTFVNGRFSRITLTKLSKQAVIDFAY